jgi:mRNA interferase MazF
MQRGDIYLASFQFGDTAAIKLRPVLLLTDRVGIGTEIVVAHISSVVPSNLLASDILLNPALPEHVSTGLRMPSVLRLHKLATIHHTSMQRRLGQILPVTQQSVDTRLRQIFCL